jgi:hypothetical protein
VAVLCNLLIDAVIAVPSAHIPRVIPLLCCGLIPVNRIRVHVMNSMREPGRNNLPSRFVMRTLFVGSWLSLYRAIYEVHAFVRYRFAENG